MHIYTEFVINFLFDITHQEDVYKKKTLCHILDFSENGLQLCTWIKGLWREYNTIKERGMKLTCRFTPGRRVSDWNSLNRKRREPKTWSGLGGENNYRTHLNVKWELERRYRFMIPMLQPLLIHCAYSSATGRQVSGRTSGWRTCARMSWWNSK